MSTAIKIVLKSGKDSSLLRFHPWVFSGAIKKIYGNPAEGDMVSVYSNKDVFLGKGHYQIGTIAVRIVSFSDIEIDRNFWRKKFEDAIELRKSVGILNTENNNVCRLLHGEGDGMPGLILDYYNGTIVFQAHSVGMYRNKEMFTEILSELLNDKLAAVYNKSETTLPFKAKTDERTGFLFGDMKNNEVLEYGNKFYVDIEAGQKTGFFIDQRENRQLLQKLSAGKKVLNMFCYTGGFSVTALKGGAKLVHSVDSSQSAIDLTNKNVQLNFGKTDNHQSFATDAFKFMDNMTEDYDIIVLDPPAFAKHNNVLHNALRGYKNLNRKAFEKLKKGGLLFTFSCSQVVSRHDFRMAVMTASAQANQNKGNVNILHQLSQPADHPVSIFHPEGEYLKGLVVCK